MADTLGDRVRALRIDRGLSQSALARDLVSPSYVSLIEAGKRVPEQAILEVFAERLGTTPEFLETGVDRQAIREELLWLRYAELVLANGQVAEALRLFEQLRSTNRQARHGAEWGRARALEAQGNLPGAIGAVEWLLAEHRAGRAETPGLLTLLNTQCRLYREAGDLNYSIALGEHALEEVRRLGLTGTEEEIRLASTVVSCYWERGDWVRANRLATEVVERAEANGSPRSRGSAYWNASLAASSVDGIALAIELADRAIASYSETDDERGIARLRTTLAWLLVQQRPPDLARVHEQLSKAYATLSELGVELDLAYCEAELARYHLVTGDAMVARQFADRSIARLSGSDVLERARAELVRAYAMAATGELSASLAGCRDTVRALRRQDKSRQQMATWREAAELLARLGEPAEAIEAYRALSDCAGVPEPAWISVSTELSPMFPFGDRAESTV
jgi:transcriptional regulator with XRE-family HTH domain